MYKYLLIFCLSVLFSTSVLGQKKDTTRSVKIVFDTVASKKADTVAHKPFIPKAKKEKIFIPDSTHSPHKAVMRSLFIPGWGQAYNRKWWKIPVIYAGLGTATYFLIFNIDSTRVFLRLSQFREHGVVPGVKDPVYSQYQTYRFATDQSIYDVYNYYQRDLDISIFAIVAAWTINLVDAYIDAKFMNAYSVDDNLSVKVTPAFINQPFYALNYNGSLIPGIKITFTLK